MSLLSTEFARTLAVLNDQQLEGLVGGENSLDCVPTCSVVQLRAVTHYLSQIYVYSLVGGVDAQSLPDVVRPKDFHPVSNRQVWKLSGKTNDGSGGGSAGTVRGSGSPEGVVTGGESVGVFHYFDTVNQQEYRFFGVDGEDTGWN